MYCTHRSKVTFNDLLKAVLRHRPDRIIVGEVRGLEAWTLLDAMNTGHRGTPATIHASSADESVRRLASLAIRSSANLQLSVAEEDVMRCSDLIVYIEVSGKFCTSEGQKGLVFEGPGHSLLPAMFVGPVK